MAHQAMQSVLAFVPEALVSSQVGTWEIDFESDSAQCDAMTAALFGLDPVEAAEGLSPGAFVRSIYPADRAAYVAKAERMRERGGLSVIEYRTVPRPGEVRWVLARGRYERDPATNTMRGRGIIIDITESKLDGMVEDKAFFLAPDGSELETPLERATGHALQVRRALDDMERQDAAPLLDIINTFLWAIGRTLAREIGDQRDEKR